MQVRSEDAKSKPRLVIGPSLSGQGRHLVNSRKDNKVGGAKLDSGDGAVRKNVAVESLASQRGSTIFNKDEPTY